MKKSVSFISSVATLAVLPVSLFATTHLEDNEGDGLDTASQVVSSLATGSGYLNRFTEITSILVGAIPDIGAVLNPISMAIGATSGLAEASLNWLVNPNLDATLNFTGGSVSPKSLQNFGNPVASLADGSGYVSSIAKNTASAAGLIPGVGPILGPSLSVLGSLTGYSNDSLGNLVPEKDANVLPKLRNANDSVGSANSISPSINSSASLAVSLSPSLAPSLGSSLPFSSASIPLSLVLSSLK